MEQLYNNISFFLNKKQLKSFNNWVRENSGLKQLFLLSVTVFWWYALSSADLGRAHEWINNQLEGQLGAKWSRMASTGKTDLYPTYFSHSSSRIVREFCLDGRKCPREEAEIFLKPLVVFSHNKTDGSL